MSFTTLKKSDINLCVITIYARSSVRIEQRISKPLHNSPNHLKNNTLTETDHINSALSLDVLLQKYPDLERIITAWPGLSEPVKAGILAMIQAVSKSKDE